MSAPQAQEVVICVDDEMMILTSLREQLRALSELGVSIEYSSDGQDALDLLDELLSEGEVVPLFISDHIMPGLKGDELLRAVAERSPETRCVLLTGQADLDAIQRAVNEAKLYRYLSKPWEQSDLLMTARSAIESYRTDRALQAERRALEETNQVFRRFVPEPFLKRIAREGIGSIQLGRVEQLELTVLFSDIRGFTGLAESMSPVELVQVLNSYFEALSEPIHALGGFIDKFIGDAVMAIFEGEAHASRALTAALEMERALARWNTGREKPVRFGVGMHSGPVVMGTVGTSTRMDSTVLGDVVNLAARLEGLTKGHEPPLIASEYTALLAERQEGVARVWRVEQIGQAQVKGRSGAVRYVKICPADG